MQRDAYYSYRYIAIIVAAVLRISMLAQPAHGSTQAVGDLHKSAIEALVAPDVNAARDVSGSGLGISLSPSHSPKDIPFGAYSSYLSIVGNVGAQFSGSTVTLTADRITNTSSNIHSGSLRLVLWFSATGYRQFGYAVATYDFALPLGPNSQYSNVSVTVPYSAPPTGCYYATFQLEEYDSGYKIADYVDFTDHKESVNNGCAAQSTCSYAIAPQSVVVDPSGGVGQVTVTGNPGGCAGSWTATSNVSWITITSGSSGSGSGTTTLSYAVASTSSPRTGSITIAGQTFSVTQAGPANNSCNYVLSAQSAFANGVGGSGSVTVTGSPSGCNGSWSASSNASWISITTGSSGAGSGPVTLSYVVAANATAASRVGTLTIAGQIFTITEAGASGFGCVASDTTLCLATSRFAVSATWRASDGSSGNGSAVPLTSDTGYFWFFGSSNVEVVIKVLNGCGLSQRYWVFAAGLTNVNVVLTIRDTVTGMVKTYTNPINTAFQPIQDTNAFATCP
jgi:hypothetical protein